MGSKIRFVTLCLGLVSCSACHQKGTVYLEDTPERYLLVEHGKNGVSSFSTTQLEFHPEIRIDKRKGLKFVRQVNDDLRGVFQFIHGLDRPRLLVETRNTNFYHVIFELDDPKALEIVADKLGMIVTKEEREILALVITVPRDGHRMKASPKRKDTTDPVYIGKDDTRLEGATMDEFARFLEASYRRPVVNKTGLDGYWSGKLSDKARRIWPQDVNEIASLDETGLQIRWEKTKVIVTLVKDAGSIKK